jgi:hypothetical protein
MKRINYLLILAAVFTLAQSFTPNRNEAPSDPLCTSPICARIDGYPFDFREQNKFATSFNASQDAVIFTFYGNKIKDKNGVYNDQKIEVEVPLKALEQGNVSSKKVHFEFNKQKFYSLPSETDFFVTDLKWNADKSGFSITASFETNVKQSASVDVNEPILGIKGQFENVTVNLPSAATAQK